MDTAFTSGAKHDFDVRRRRVAGTKTAVDQSSGPAEVEKKKDVVKVGTDYYAFIHLLLIYTFATNHLHYLY